MAANNQGIAHYADRTGGRPWCLNRRAHMSDRPETIDSWGKGIRICAKCEAVRVKRTTKAAGIKRTE